MNVYRNYGQLSHICIKVMQQNELIIKVIAEATPLLSAAFFHQNKDVP